MTKQRRMIPDLPYPGGVTGTYKPEEQSPENWFREHLAHSERLVAVEVVRNRARYYNLNATLQATGIAYAAWSEQGRIWVEIYPFHEAVKPNDDAHNFFWQVRTEDENPTFFDSCPRLRSC